MHKPIWNEHPAVRTGDDLTLGERAADRAVTAMGSWTFLLIQTLFIGLWMTLNVVAWCAHWDPRPWIMLNLIFSIQAAYAAPLVLLAQRRTDQRNSELAEADLATDRESLTLIREMHTHLLGGDHGA